MTDAHTQYVGLLTRLLGLEERSALDPSEEYPDIDALLLARQRASRTSVTPPTINEALGIPAIMRAVSLIATTLATLNLRAYKGDELVDPLPTFVRRPCRQWTSGEFWRDTAYSMATRGEAVWLTMERDFAGYPLSVVPVMPASMLSKWDGLEHKWSRRDKNSGREIPYASDVVTHITLLRDPETGRGIGPLQRCGAAITVAEEADRWAARFFAGGGAPSVVIKLESPVSQTEADELKATWVTDPPGTPRVVYGADVKDYSADPERSQLTESRRNTRAEVALMFGIPGRLLEYAESGSSITYANVGDLAMELVRLTLAPYYLEPMEQAFSDLLPRGTEVRFDVEGLQRADAKTRYAIHKEAIALGVYDVEHAQAIEGVPIGALETAQTAQTAPVLAAPRNLREVV